MKKLEFPHALIQVAILNSLRKAHFIASLYFAWCKSRHDILVPPYLFGAVARVWVEANQSTRLTPGGFRDQVRGYARDTTRQTVM